MKTTLIDIERQGISGDLFTVSSPTKFFLINSEDGLKEGLLLLTQDRLEEEFPGCAAIVKQHSQQKTFTFEFTESGMRLLKH